MNSNRLSKGVVAMAGVMLAVATIAKEPPKKPQLGSQAPGVQIPFALLKPEAEIPFDSAISGAAFSKDAIFAAGGSIIPLDPKTNKPGTPIAGLADLCGNLVSAHDAYWIASCGTAGALHAIGVKESKPKAAIAAPLVSATTSAASTPDSLWLLADSKTSLWRIDPKLHTVVADIRLPAACSSLLYAESSLWIPCPGSDKLLRVDPATNLVDKRIDVPGQPFEVIAGEGSLWVYTRKEGKLVQVDPKTNKVSATIDLGVPGAPASLAFGEGSVWISMPEFPVARVHAATAKLIQQFSGVGGGRVFFGVNSLWLAGGSSKTLLRFDPKRIAATLAE